MSSTPPSPTTSSTRHRNYPLHLHISTLFLVLVLTVGALIAYLSYQRSASMLHKAVASVFERMAQETVGEQRQLTQPAAATLGLLSLDRLAQARDLDTRIDALPVLAQALRSNAALSALYLGYEDGSFFMLRRLGGAAERKHFNAPAQAVFMVQSVARDRGTANAQAQGHFIYLSAELALIRSDLRPDYVSFDPRSRGWYQLAQRPQEVVRTDPYIFFSSGQIGVTLAQRSSVGPAVIGADIELATLSEVLQRQKLTPDTEIALFDRQRRLIAHSNAAFMARPTDENANASGTMLTALSALQGSVLRHIADPASLPATNTRASLTQVEDKGRQWHTAQSQLPGTDTQPVFMAIAVPDDQLLADARNLLGEGLLVTLAVLLITAPLTYMLARAVAKPLRRLAGTAESVRNLDFSQGTHVNSWIREVDELADAMDSMRRTIRRFIDITATVAAEPDFQRLLPRLLGETVAAAGAREGILYLATGDDEAGKESLQAAAIRIGDDSRNLEEQPSLALASAPDVLQHAIATRRACAESGHLSAADAATLGLTQLGFPDHKTNRPAIAVPLFNRQHHLVGAILLLGDQQVEAAHLNFIAALCGSSAVSLESRALIQQQKALFEAFIQLIASAIDAKSPYTGGHCARVPELTKMLARAACNADDGPYKDFNLDADEWEAVHVAAWLHDCGKVTTPEYVVDKATKLETIYDRIHEVRMRFEVLKRDAEIRALKAIADGAAEDATYLELAQTLATLDEEFAFVATCNEGGEFMAPEKIARLEQIAQRTWLRTLDDSLGLAHEEKARRAVQTNSSLPVTENLLADKAEHRIARRETERLGPDNPWGFHLNQPELLYNRGELYNLRVSRGTLSEEERYKINDHIIQTIIMLTRLPFPKHLKKVPEIAGGHHEKMDGTGYPKRLRGNDMSPLARMMAIADIFEALTATDRPYKKPKTLSEAIRIMSFMKKDQHIDPELFTLFLQSGVYLDYARQFMPQELIDHVDIGEYL